MVCSRSCTDPLRLRPLQGLHKGFFDTGSIPARKVASDQVGARLLSAGVPRHLRRMSVLQNGSAGELANLDGMTEQDIRIAAPNVELQALPEYLKKECLLFYYPETEPLARQIAAKSSNVELGNIRWRHVHHCYDSSCLQQIACRRGELYRAYLCRSFTSKRQLLLALACCLQSVA